LRQARVAGSAQEVPRTGQKMTGCLELEMSAVLMLTQANLRSTGILLFAI